ncbi:MAG: 4'-phosphopantetheinyl transferase superfamily protein [Sphingobacteriaceae bacterium]|nr:4'-phosphopantetheinyl transferase superfamily protein [Cytophagaceae bacterium]
MLHLLYHTPPENTSEAEETTRLSDTLPPAFRPDLSPNLSVLKQHQRVAARWLLSELFLRKKEAPEAVQVLRQSPDGKPFVPGRFEFSLAHTNGLVVAAGTDRGRVGVDVESVRPLEPAHFHAFFTPAELTHIAATPDPSRELLRYWTRREALVKADGRGFRAWSQCVDEGESGYLCDEARRYHLIDLNLPEGFVGALCYEVSDEILLEKLD